MHFSVWFFDFLISSFVYGHAVTWISRNRSCIFIIKILVYFGAFCLSNVIFFYREELDFHLWGVKEDLFGSN